MKKFFFLKLSVFLHSFSENPVFRGECINVYSTGTSKLIRFTAGLLQAPLLKTRTITFRFSHCCSLLNPAWDWLKCNSLLFWCIHTELPIEFLKYGFSKLVGSLIWFLSCIQVWTSSVKAFRNNFMFLGISQDWNHPVKRVEVTVVGRCPFPVIIIPQLYR